MKQKHKLSDAAVRFANFREHPLRPVPQQGTSA
jgi:hypothetical protein